MIEDGCPFSRRRFLKAAGGAAGALAASALFPPILRAAAGRTADVAVSSASSPAERARGAVALLGGMKSFVSRGDVVVLKPNIGWDRTPDQAATTDPEFVVAVAEMCLAAGAGSVRVFDRTCNDARRCYVNSGIKDAVERFARKNRVGDTLRIYHVEDRKFVRTSIPNALSIRAWDFYRDALEADRIVNLPIAKHHSLSGVTLGLKNMMGIMGGNRGQIHYRLSECLVDIHRRVPVALTVIDAGRILLRNGPSGGSLADVKAFGKAFASRDVVAADVVAAERIFRLSPRDVDHIGKAMGSGLGIASAAQIRLVEGGGSG
ncbi:MAG TPA: DUF362 domain-containing protein [Candidatus Deferrimicrobium sp.]|nr:DUF362 domain-containing protein [Candidatus Deferrimicrobium sp.]